ncbi:MAG: aminotransferase class III-fold pyridoxal phosphate-dependent enzyme [Atopobiaceae bacterium]|nr:aminotransferase class III-fold pyridoxal phosphate-dependent enzyme [Atopobiaceae bacterium]
MDDMRDNLGMLSGLGDMGGVGGLGMLGALAGLGDLSTSTPTTMPYVAAETADLDDEYVMHTFARMGVEFVAGQGSTLTDAAGNQYLDFVGGIGSCSLGHCHPMVVRALQYQAGRLWQVGNYYHTQNRGELAHSISQFLSKTTDDEGHITGDQDIQWRSFFSNSGAESMEGAIKIARRHGERNLKGAYGIITARRSFHGRTFGALAATGQDHYHESFQPLPRGFAHVQLNDYAALVEMIDNPPAELGPVCAVALECIQGEGGVWPAQLDYLIMVSELCRDRGLLLIIDEVQTGFFRTGAPFAFQRAGIVPDVVAMAKGLGGGFPIGAVAARAEVADLMGPGDHGSTFGGNPLGCAVARAVVEEMESGELGEHVLAVGEHLAGALSALPHVSEVRGAGLLRAAQLDTPRAQDIVREGLAQGLVLNSIGDSILRFLPPLVVGKGQVDILAERLKNLIEKLA